MRPGFGDFASQREAVECPRHLHVGKQQDYVGVSHRQKFVRSVAMISFQHLKSSLLKDLDHLHSDDEVIVYHKRTRIRRDNVSHYHESQCREQSCRSALAKIRV